MSGLHPTTLQPGASSAVSCGVLRVVGFRSCGSYVLCCVVSFLLVVRCPGCRSQRCFRVWGIEIPGFSVSRLGFRVSGLGLREHSQVDFEGTW